jgi:hypothetical protein
VIHRQSCGLTLLVLVAWIVLGPIGMAFEACAAMMALALCDGGPCGVVTALVSTAPTVVPPIALAESPAPLAQHPIAVLRSALEPPPKLVRLSA